MKHQKFQQDRKSRVTGTSSIILFLIAFPVLLGCFWDKDTIEMEKQQFPTVMELIAGKFLRHSPEYHYWRIKDRELKLESHADSLPLYDDLAVSLSKTGKDKEAIGIMQKKESLQPGLYETYANMGTFYLHDKNFEKGLEYIDKAIEINPDAHFGREIYQRHLAEYLLSKKKGNELQLPLDTNFSTPFEEPKEENFYYFLLNKHKGNKESFGGEPLEKAVKGISGMIKFGNHNSPILFEALGDLLINNWFEQGARQLAARAYLKASYAAKDQSAKEGYKRKALSALKFQNDEEGKKMLLSTVEKELKKELAEGEQYYQKIRGDEINWIRSGKNPEKLFAEKYYDAPEIKGDLPDDNTGGSASLEELEFPSTVSSSNKAMIDSVFESKQSKNKATANESGNEESSDNFKYFLAFGMIALFLGIGVVVFILLRRK